MGEPQGVMLTHENLSANALAMFTGIPNLELGAKEVILPDLKAQNGKTYLQHN